MVFFAKDIPGKNIKAVKQAEETIKYFIKEEASKNLSSANSKIKSLENKSPNINVNIDNNVKALMIIFK